jgi:hypothetical protein
MKYESQAVLPSEFKAHYEKLCALRDKVNAKNAPLEDQLTLVNAEIEVLRLKAEGLAAKIDSNRGHENWILLKQDIGQLAFAISGHR